MTPGVPTAKRFAVVPRAVVLHRMETSDCLDSRLFWAIILWSWCGVEVSPDGSVVLKDEEGWLKKDTKGKPIPAKQEDLRELLGLAPGMRGAISRAIARLEEVGSIRFGKTISGGRGAKIMYPVQEPPSPKAKSELLVQATLEVWHIGTRLVSTANLPEDTLARTKAIEWLNSLSTMWLKRLKDARTECDQELVQGAAEHGILIESSSKSRVVKSPPPTSQPSIEVEEPKEPEEPKPAGRLEGGDSEKSLGTQVFEHLSMQPQFRQISDPLTKPIVEEVKRLINTPQRLQQFRDATAPDRFKGPPRKWALIIQIAQRVAEDGDRYQEAAAGNGHSPPKSKSEMRREAFIREMEAENKSRDG